MHWKFGQLLRITVMKVYSIPRRFSWSQTFGFNKISSHLWLKSFALQKYHSDLLTRGDSMVVEHLPYHSKVKGSSLTAERRREKVKLGDWLKDK